MFSTRIVTFIVVGVLLWPYLGCVQQREGRRTEEIDAASPTRDAITETRARELALQLARESGYDVDAYAVTVNPNDEGRLFLFKMRAREGLVRGRGDPYHFFVSVNANGSATLQRGA